MKKVAFYTLGCKLNFAETSSISQSFAKRGFEIVDFENTPDIFVINTCSVTENADKKCGKIVQEAKKISLNSYVVIIGCFAQLKPHEVGKIEGVNMVLGASEKFNILDHLDKLETNKIIASEIDDTLAFHSSYSLKDRTRSFLKVQDGCDYSCSFCTIPLARGMSRSDSIENVVLLAKKIAATGVKEIVLTGVNIGDFGIQKGKREERFLALIQALDSISYDVRFRISSIEPNLLSNEIIHFVSISNKFVPHFHIPLQSGSDRVLTKMRRRYKSSLYKQRVEKIKSIMPDCCIGVDVITGFPEERNEDYLTTYEFLNQIEISYLHVFSFSKRKKTIAYNMKEVPQQVIRDRATQLRSLSEKKKRVFYESQLGKSHRILFENKKVDDKIYGFTENYLRVATPYDAHLVNRIVDSRISKLDKEGNGVVEEVKKQMIDCHSI